MFYQNFSNFELKGVNNNQLIGGLRTESQADKIKAVIKPYFPGLWSMVFPFGVPRDDYHLMLDYREIGDYTPVVATCKRIISDTVSTIDWKITSKSKNQSHADEITERLLHPENCDSLKETISKSLEDMLTVGSGVWVKNFSDSGELVNFNAVDSSTFLKNPNWHGTYEGRLRCIPPSDQKTLVEIGKMVNDNELNTQNLAYRNYNSFMKERPAYFQYGGYNTGPVPIPFGWDEILFIEPQCKTWKLYPTSPIRTLWSVIKSIYFSDTSVLEYYISDMTPKGFVSFTDAIAGGQGASADYVKTLMEQLQQKIIYKHDRGGVRSHKHKLVGVNLKVDWTPIQNLDLIPLEWRFEWDDITRSVYGVPPSMAGFTRDSNVAIDRNQRRLFIEGRLQSILNTLAERINYGILPHWDSNRDLNFQWINNDMAYMLEEVNWRSIMLATKQRTVNEFRKEDHLADVSWGDEPDSGGVGLMGLPQPPEQKPNETLPQTSEKPETDFMGEFNRLMEAESSQNESEQPTEKEQKSFYDDLEYS